MTSNGFDPSVDFGLGFHGFDIPESGFNGAQPGEDAPVAVEDLFAAPHATTANKPGGNLIGDRSAREGPTGHQGTDTDGFSTIGESPPPPKVPIAGPPPPSPPETRAPELEPVPVVPEPEDYTPEPAPVVNTAVADQAASDAQIEADAAADRRRRAALIRERQNPTGPRGLLTRPLVQRPRLLGH